MTPYKNFFNLKFKFPRALDSKTSAYLDINKDAKWLTDANLKLIWWLEARVDQLNEVNPEV